MHCEVGQSCTVSITGISLLDGHQLVMVASESCTGTLLKVSDVPNSGMSQPATDAGSVYTWGNVSADFLPEPGNYTLCWCANMNGLVCDNLQDFQILAGQLQVSGPFREQLFVCARGQDCSPLQPLQGVGLTEGSHVAIRSDGCGTPNSLQVSESNLLGIAKLEDGLKLSFGTSNLQADHRVNIDSSESGYDLCWCSKSCCQGQDFVAPAGKLRIEGPRANQEISCSVGQACC